MRMKTIENLDTGYQDIKINLNGTKSINVTKAKDNTDTIHTMPIKDELVGNYKQKINLIIDKFIHECKLKNYIVEKINGNQIFTIKRIDGKIDLENRKFHLKKPHSIQEDREYKKLVNNLPKFDIYYYAATKLTDDERNFAYNFMKKCNKTNSKKMM